MKIYFDNVLINEDAYAGLENTYKGILTIDWDITRPTI
jgi:hypothetical protein